MNNISKTEIKSPRVNPFLFPSDTDFRFVLLIVAVSSVGFYIYSWLFTYLSYTAIFGNIGDVYMRCANNAISFFQLRIQTLLGGLTNPQNLLAPSNSIQETLKTPMPYEICTSSFTRLQGFWMLGCNIFMLFLAFVLYYTEPWRKIYRENLLPLAKEDASEVIQAIVDLCQEAKLNKMPSLVWNPLNSASSGLAFGRLGRYYISLTGGLVSEFYVNPQNFRAVLRHEIAHLKNADVDKTYFAIACWQAFIMLALIPFILTLLHGVVYDSAEYKTIAPLFLVEGLIFAGLVYFFRNSILRVREEYADLRASVWDGLNGALPQVIRQLPQPPHQFWKRLLTVHPDPNTRLLALEDPKRLMQVDFWTFFGIGFVSTIAYNGVDKFLFSILPNNQTWNSFVATLVFTAISSISVGLIIWRNAFANRISKSEPPKITLSSLGFAFGLGLGPLVSLSATVNYQISNPFANLGSILFNIVFYPIWFCLLWGLVYLLIKWISVTASIWLEAIHSPVHLWFVIIPSLLILVFVLAYFMSGILQTQLQEASFGWSNSMLIFGAYLFSGFSDNYTLLIPFGLSVFPLSAYFWQRKPSSLAPSWFFLDQVDTPAYLPNFSPLQLRSTITTSLIGSVGYIVLMVAARLILKICISKDVQSTDLYRILLFYGLILFAGIIQAVIGLIVFRQVQYLKSEHAIFSVLIGGSVMAIGLLIVNLFYGGSIDLKFVLMTINFSVKIGFGLTLLLVFVFLIITKGIQNLWLRLVELLHFH